jgi:hypothetical protein
MPPEYGNSVAADIIGNQCFGSVPVFTVSGYEYKYFAEYGSGYGQLLNKDRIQSGSRQRFITKFNIQLNPDPDAKHLLETAGKPNRPYSIYEENI